MLSACRVLKIRLLMSNYTVTFPPVSDTQIINFSVINATVLKWMDLYFIKLLLLHWPTLYVYASLAKPL